MNIRLNEKVLCEGCREKEIKKLTDKCGNEEIAKLLYECRLNREQYYDDYIRWESKQQQLVVVLWSYQRSNQK